MTHAHKFGFRNRPASAAKTRPVLALLICASLLNWGAIAQEAAPVAETAASTPVAAPALETVATPVAIVEVPKPKFDMVDAAARYVALVKEANRMTYPNALASESIASSLVITSRVSSKDITEGIGAYVTLSVANDPSFASGVQTAVGLLGRDVVIKRLEVDPAGFLAMISGSADASKIASGAVLASTERLSAAQTALAAAAYALQKERWAMQAVDTQATLAAHRAAAITPSGLTPFVATDLPANASDGPVNSRYLLAASYHLLGDDATATAMLDKPLGRMCMNRVQLNVRQCLAASQFPFEHAFCLSQHSFGEALTCVKDAVK
jgi:hypothetical protein